MFEELAPVAGSLRESSQKEPKKAALHWPGIEPGPPAWQARILPLNHQCFAALWLTCRAFLKGLLSVDTQRALTSLRLVWLGSCLGIQQVYCTA